MFKFLKKPYPFNFDIIYNAKLIFLISIITSLFVFIFQPLKISEFSNSAKLETVAFIGLITFAVLSFYMLVLPSYLTKLFDIDKWNVLKELIWESIVFISLFAALYVYFFISKIFEFSLIDLFKIIAISAIPVLIIIILNQNRLLKQNFQNANELNKKILHKQEAKIDLVLFESEIKKESISINPNSIILIKSANNYIEIYWENQNKLLKNILRLKLNQTEELLKDYNFISKCHRSYLVNTQKIIKAIASPQGLKLTLEYLDFQIPVSQTYLKKLKELI